MAVHPGSPVSTIMSWPVATIDHEATVEEAAEYLAADDIGVLLVLRERALAGLISERDVVAHVAVGTDLSHLLVGEAMAPELVTITPETTKATEKLDHASTAAPTTGPKTTPAFSAAL